MGWRASTFADEFKQSFTTGCIYQSNYISYPKFFSFFCSFNFWFHEYAHVGWTTRYVECHLVFCLFYRDFKLLAGCTFFCLNGVRLQERSYHGWFVDDNIGCVHEICCGVGTNLPCHVASLIFSTLRSILYLFLFLKGKFSPYYFWCKLASWSPQKYTFM